MDDLRAARGGDVAARNRVIESACPYLYLLRIASNEMSVELQRKASPADLLQETLLIAVKKFPCFLGQAPHELLRWLRRILLYKLANFKRAASRRARREVPLEQADFDEASARQERHQCAALTRIGDLLAKMAPPESEIIYLREAAELPFDEIAELLGCSNDAAQKRFTRAFNRLLKLVPPLTR